MMKNSKKLDKENLENCPLCASKDFKNNEINALGYQYGINENFNFCKCHDCGVLFQNPRVHPECISVYYDENYYTHDKPIVVEGDALRNIRLRFIKKIRVLKWKLQSYFDYRFPKSKGRLLDYGAGSGHFLNMLHHNGWNDLWGYDTDPMPFVSEDGNANRIYESDLFPPKNQLLNSFDYIVSYHSLEHIANPVEIMELWFQLLKPGGQLIIATPSANSLNYKWFKKYWYFLTPPYHYVIYTSGGLEKSLEKLGFKALSTKYHSNSQCLWGSLDIILQKNNVINNKPLRVLLNNQRLLSFVSKPVMLILDYFNRGDNLVVKVTKPVFKDKP